MQKKSNIKKGLLFQNSSVRTEMLYKNMEKYNMVDTVLSPAIGTAYNSHQNDTIKLSQIKGGLLKKTYGENNVDNILYSVNTLSNLSNEYNEGKNYIDYINNTNGSVTWYDKVGAYIRSNELTFEGLKIATLFEDAPGIVRYVQPVLATTGIITTNLNSTRNIDTKLGTLSNLFYGTTLRNAAYLNNLRKTKTITPNIKNEYGNNVSNLYNLPYLLPIDEGTGRVAGFDNGYNGNFIKKYELIPSKEEDSINKIKLDENCSEYLAEIINELVNKQKYFINNPYIEFSQRYEDSNNIYDSVISTRGDLKEESYSKMLTEESNDSMYSLRSDFYGGNDNGITYITENDGSNEYYNYYRKGEGGSILSYTNKLFNKGKIGTLLNTYSDENGISKGSGVDCRVWTSKTPYSKVNDLVRRGNNFIEFEKLQELKGFIPKENIDYLSNNTVLNKENGFVNIVPSNKSSIDIKKCMFSIENLAWKDVKHEDNANFPKYEQGPEKGRIMWFPPYNLKFTENVGVNWNRHNFIGRGEQIYTYTNTERSGTLSFTILIDNPSMLETYKKYNASKDDYVNFFAGCDIITEPQNYEIEENTPNKESVPEEQPNTYNYKNYKFSIYFPNNYSGIDSINTDSSFPFHYLVYGYNANCGQYNTLEGLLDTRGYEMLAKGVTSDNESDTSYNNYYYNIDEEYETQKLNESNYRDSESYKLNCKGDGDSDFNFIDIYTCLEKIGMHDNATEKNMIIDYFVNNRGANKDNIKVILENIVNKYDDIEEILVEGCASSHGNEVSNNKLAKNRADVVKGWLKSKMYIHPNIIKTDTVDADVTTSDSINDITAKYSRRVDVTIKVRNGEVSETSIQDRTQPNSENNEKTEQATEKRVIEKINEYNEADFFDYIASDGSFIQQYTEKVKYFSPAFHSISPEGFNSRLNFIHQCTRQGGTYEATEKGMVSGNLAFGRAPVCILRIGDFYNTRIIIESVTIDYDNNQWDLNPEGTGVQPMVANVNMTFKFIGGSSLGGAINRLQNALSFNYYANTSAFEKRSDISNVDNEDNNVIYRKIEVENKNNMTQLTTINNNIEK